MLAIRQGRLGAPAAAIFDLGRAGDFSARRTAEMGYEAALAAGAQTEGDVVVRGNVGAGTGAAIGAVQTADGTLQPFPLPDEGA